MGVNQAEHAFQTLGAAVANAVLRLSEPVVVQHALQLPMGRKLSVEIQRSTLFPLHLTILAQCRAMDLPVFQVIVTIEKRGDPIVVQFIL